MHISTVLYGNNKEVSLLFLTWREEFSGTTQPGARVRSVTTGKYGILRETRYLVEIACNINFNDANNQAYGKLNERTFF